MGAFVFEINQIQALQFALMKRSSFNEFDGPRVVRDLLANRGLWCGALMDRAGSNFLIKLRDLGHSYWNVDTLYILSSGANDEALRRIAEHWRADTVEWVSGRPAERLLGESLSGGRSPRILEVWWD